MEKISNAVETLASLLQGSMAKPVIAPSRLAPSAIYDVEYRTAVIAFLFEKFARPFGTAGHRRISSAKLKLLQFITFRPWLIPGIREWSKGEDQGALLLTQSMRSRKGFLSDTAHEDLISMLVACEIFMRVKGHLVTGKRADKLAEIVKATEKDDLFHGVRQIISDLESITLTNSMLEGY